MNLSVFCIHDVKAGAYLPPFFLPQVAMAARTFADCVNDPTHAFGKNPQDYTLYHLGSYDDNTAEIILQEKRSIGNGMEFKQEKSTESQIDLEEANNDA